MEPRENLSLTDVYAGKYFGTEKIASVEPVAKKTPSGAYIFSVKFESGAAEVWPQRAFVALVSDEPRDATTMRDIQVNLMTPQILDVIREYNIPFEQFTYAMVRVASEHQNHFNRANAILWLGSADKYIPGSDTLNMLSIHDADRINATQPADEK